MLEAEPELFQVLLSDTEDVTVTKLVTTVPDVRAFETEAVKTIVPVVPEAIFHVK